MASTNPLNKLLRKDVQKVSIPSKLFCLVSCNNESLDKEEWNSVSINTCGACRTKGLRVSCTFLCPYANYREKAIIYGFFSMKDKDKALLLFYFERLHKNEIISELYWQEIVIERYIRFLGSHVNSLFMTWQP